MPVSDSRQEDCDVPDLVSDTDSENDIKEDDYWDDLDEENGEDEFHPLQGNVKCLFCFEESNSVDLSLYHCKTDHSFDLIHSCKAFGVDCISYIKMINYIRGKHPNPEEVLALLSQGGQAWSGQEYMAAENVDDLMLQFDIESAASCLPLETQTSSGDEPALAAVPDHKEYGRGDSSSYTESEAIHALVSRIHRAEEERNLCQQELERALQQIEQLRIAGQQMMLQSSEKGESSKLKASPSQSLNEEDGYFASYTHHDIHMTMLKDKVRTESYRDFMLKNPQLFEGKTVLDVGCGTGILSMFAVKAGAQHVVAVDQSNIIYQAMDIARENNMHEKITFVKGRLEDADLPIKQFDVIISEWMGYFLLFEAMLDSVLWARARYLSPGGCVYPDHFSMIVVGISDLELRRAKLEFWDDVYGFKMSCMKSSVWDEVNVRLVNKDHIVTEPAVIKELDVTECTVSDLDFASDFSLHCRANAEITALVGYFDTDFNRGCQEKVSFSTGPHATPTHWEQAVMMLPKPVCVTAGQDLQCKIVYRKHPQDTRGIIITLHIGKQKLKYSLS